jgi:GAF domain-containing protein
MGPASHSSHARCFEAPPSFETTATLHSAGLIEPESTPAFDHITRLAAHALNAPIAVLTLGAPGRELLRSQFGLGDDWTRGRPLARLHASLAHGESLERTIVAASKQCPSVDCEEQLLPVPTTAAYLGATLRAANGTSVGTLAICDTHARAWTAPESAMLSEFASITEAVLASVYDRLRRQSAEDERNAFRFKANEARCALERVERYSALLAEATVQLSRAGNSAGILDTLARLCVPTLGDWCVIYLASHPNGALAPAAAFTYPMREDQLRQLLDLYAVAGRERTGLAQAFSAGRPHIIPDVDDAWLRDVVSDASQLALLRALAPRSLMFIPLVLANRVLGVLSLARMTPGRCYTPDDLETAVRFSGLAALAVARMKSDAAERTSPPRLCHSQTNVDMALVLPLIPGPTERARDYLSSKLASAREAR